MIILKYGIFDLCKFSYLREKDIGMGILSTIFFKKDNDRNNSVAISTNNVQSNFNALTVHQDLKDLLWIADGPNKNYIPKPHTN